MNSLAAPLRVLHVAETAKGGVGSYIDDVMTRQHARAGAMELRVVLPRAHADQLRQVPLEQQVAYRSGSIRGLGMLVLAWTTLRTIWRWRPDLVHLHSTGAGLALRPLLWLLPRRPRLVYCAHGWAFDRETGAASKGLTVRLERWLSRCCDAIVCISEHDRRAAMGIGIPADRLCTIYNGIADVAPPSQAAVEEATERWPAQRLRVLFVGRLDHQKGVDLLYEAIAPLAAEVHALVIGQAVVGDTSAGAPPGNVSFAGWVAREHLPGCYAAADVLAVPSRWEGLGLVALEAMRAGRPVIAAATGGLKEVVEDGVTGCWITPGSAAALRAALQELTPELRRAQGAAGRQRFLAHFRIETTADQLDALYRRLLIRGPATARARTVSASADR